MVDIADVITEGARPRDLNEVSEWQNGPRFLSLAASEWPVRSAKELTATARENISKLQKKAFVAVLTRAKAKQKEPQQSQTARRRPPAGPAIQSVQWQFSVLTCLVKTVAWVWRAARMFIGQNQAMNRPKWESVSAAEVISVREREDALRDIFHATQEATVFPGTTTDRRLVYRDQDSGLLLCEGRMQAFRENQVSLPILSSNAWVSTLLAREAYKEAHDGVAGTFLRMIRKAWIVRGGDSPKGR